MATMNVSLPDDLSDFVAAQLKDGGYNNQSEVVREGLRLLRIRDAKLRRLRVEISVAIAGSDAGNTRPLTDDVLREIADRARQNSVARKAPRR